MDSITIDGMHEDAFRQSIEDLLRRGLADEAGKRLRALLEPYTGEGQLFPARFMAVSPEDIELSGWETLDEGFRKYDRAEQPVTAICLSFGDPEGKPSGPDSAGLLSLTVETSYFSDEAFPFSESDRNDLLDGYSSFGCQWAGDCEGVDHAISFRGVDDLHGSLAGLEARLLATHNPDPEEIRAGTIASCFLAVLFHQALRISFARRRLGRPLCVLTANNGVYPSFDAPVLACDEYLSGGDVVAVAAAIAPEWVPDESFAPAHAADDEDEGAEEASLLSIGIRRTAKQPVLALAEGDGDMSMDAMANAALGGGPVPPPPPSWSFEDEYDEPAPVEPQVVEEDVFEDPASFVEVAEEPDALAVPGFGELWPASEPEAEEPSADFHAEVLSEGSFEEVEPPVETGHEDVVGEAAEPEVASAEAESEMADWPELEIWEQATGEVPAPFEAAEPRLGDTEWPVREEPIAAIMAAPEAQTLSELDEGEEDRVPTRSPSLPGHSLRARLGTADMELYEPDKPSLWSRLIDWIEAKLRKS